VVEVGLRAVAAAEAAPRIRLASVGRYLKVNIDPNLSGTKSWTFVLQRRTGAYPWRYVTVGRFRTLGSSETRSLLLPTRTYRVVVPAQHGYARGVARIRHYADVAAPRVVLDERSVLTLGMPGQPGRGLLHLVVAADDAMGTRPVGTSSGVARVVARRGDRVLGQLRVARLGVLPKNWVDSLNVRVDWDGLVPDHWRSVQVRAWDRSGNASGWTTVPLTVAPKPQIRWRQIDTVSMWLGGTACGVSTTGAAYCWGGEPLGHARRRNRSGAEQAAGPGQGPGQRRGVGVGRQVPGLRGQGGRVAVVLGS
jgi:hypothetical protein